MKTGKEEIKLFLIAVNMIVYLNNPRESTDTRQVNNSVKRLGKKNKLKKKAKPSTCIQQSEVIAKRQKKELPWI